MTSLKKPLPETPAPLTVVAPSSTQPSSKRPHSDARPWPGVPPDSQPPTSAEALVPRRSPVEQLVRLAQATHKRSFERPIVHFGMFDANRIPVAQEAALEFLVVNMTFIERTSTPNLAALAKAAPIAEIRDCFTAQIQDEIVHGDMLTRWLALAGIESPEHGATRFGVKAAELIQHHAWLGIKNAEILTEHFASALIDELTPRIDEPLLKFILGQIQKDEQRHKVIAIESVRALREAGHHRSFIALLFGPIVERGTIAFFKHVFGGFLAKQCAALELPHERILERTLDEVHDALRDDARP